MEESDKKRYKMDDIDMEEPKEETKAEESAQAEPVGDFRKKNDYQLSLEEDNSS